MDNSSSLALEAAPNLLLALRSMNSGEIQLAAVAVVAGAVFLFRIGNKIRARSKVADTPTSRLATAAQGRIEAEGFAWPAGEAVVSPTGNQCVLLRLALQELQSRGSGKNRRREWVTVWSQTQAPPFYIVDPTGLAVVHGGEAELQLRDHHTMNWNALPTESRNRVKELVGASVARFPPSDSLWGIFSSSFRVVESQILIGSPLLVAGTFLTKRNPEAPIKDSALDRFAKRMLDLKSRKIRHNHFALDTNRDGKVSEEESFHGSVGSAKVAQADRTSLPENLWQIHGEFREGNGQPLMLADAHQHHLLERLNRGLWIDSALLFALIGFAYWLWNYVTR